MDGWLVAQAAGWGLVGGGALVLGAVPALLLRIPARLLGLVMAFGSGVLISALAFELTTEAFEQGGRTVLVAGLAAGALTFYLGDRLLDQQGGQHRKRSGGQQADGKPAAIVLGSVLDGIPESVAIGVSLVGEPSVSIAVVAAVFLSNVPESLAGSVGLRKAGHSTPWILGMWTAIALASGISAAAGYALLGAASPAAVAAAQAFAAGAILTMLADTMMPEAFEHGGSATGLVASLGFTSAFLLSQGF